MNKIMSAADAATLIKNNSTVLMSGHGGGVLEADFVLREIEKCYLETGEPKNLTLVHVSGVGNKNEKGVSRFAHKGMVKRVIGGHWGWSSKMAQLALDNEIEAYTLPQGVLSLLMREIAAKRVGLLTKVGLGTFADPRIDGGRLNTAAKEDLVELVHLAGEELLLYKAFPIDAVVLQGSTADTDGNISLELEPSNLEVLACAQAAYNSGGIVICQVKRIVQPKQLRPRNVHIPGFMVSAVVVNPDQWQTVEGEYNAGFSGEYRVPLSAMPKLEFGPRKWVARRAAMELQPGAVVNLGYGIADGVANIAAEENILEDIIFCIEQGLIGGIPSKGDIFGTCLNPDALIDAPSQFDFFHGGGLDMTFLGMAQADAKGNVNVSRFGTAITGAGGFIDISQNTKKVTFCGTFTAGGVDIACENGVLRIVREGKIRKFVSKVEHITFNGDLARACGQKILYVTERAVFSLEPEGFTLIEIAPGIDLERDVLSHMDFRPRIARELKKMDNRIFKNTGMNLPDDLKRRKE
ncbi:MAG TPA: CoA-transferase [Spirochaetales bacterium]|nr:CoA-transferase [Spirochaetales bacterium]